MELKPCPFCGSEADIYQAKGYRRLSTKDSKFRVRCSDKHCIAHYLTLYSPSKAVVVEAWNRRANGEDGEPGVKCIDCQRDCQMIGLDMPACTAYKSQKGEKLMYGELVKDLRENHDKYFARDMQAADAIEELQCKR